RTPAHARGEPGAWNSKGSTIGAIPNQVDRYAASAPTATDVPKPIHAARVDSYTASAYRASSIASVSIDPDGADTRHASQASPSTSHGNVRRKSRSAMLAAATAAPCMTVSQTGRPSCTEDRK